MGRRAHSSAGELLDGLLVDCLFDGTDGPRVRLLRPGFDWVADFDYANGITLASTGVESKSRLVAQTSICTGNSNENS